MYRYDPKSLVADEFINHQEILDTLAYADQHKDDLALVDEILQKAEERQAARKAKDWAKADAIRNELTAAGYAIEDTPTGPKVKKI